MSFVYVSAIQIYTSAAVCPRWNILTVQIYASVAVCLKRYILAAQIHTSVAVCPMRNNYVAAQIHIHRLPFVRGGI